MTISNRRGRAKRGHTREQILCLGERLLLERGYNGFSYQHIAKELGIRNAAIHYHFATKEDLGCALVGRFRELFSNWCAQISEETSDPWAQLEGYFTHYLDYVDDRHEVCFSGLLAADFGAVPDSMREQVRLSMELVYDWLVGILQVGDETDRIRFNGTAEDKAVAIGAALQGGITISRAAGAHRFHQLLDQLRLELSPKKAAAGVSTETSPVPMAA